MYGFAYNLQKQQANTWTKPAISQPKANSPWANQYTESERLALALGYREVADDNAFRGRYFIKDGKKWIHNLEALRRTLNQGYGRYIDDEELATPVPEGFGYDVEAYYSYNFKPETSLQQNEGFQRLLSQVKVH